MSESRLDMGSLSSNLKTLNDSRIRPVRSTDSSSCSMTTAYTEYVRTAGRSEQKHLQGKYEEAQSVSVKLKDHFIDIRKVLIEHNDDFDRSITKTSQLILINKTVAR